MSEQNSQAPTVGIHIDKLNYDCLLQIFSYLPIPDKFTIPLVCKQWNSVSHQTWTTVKSLELSDEFWESSNDSTTMKNYFSKVIQKCGKYITHIDLIHLENELCNFIFSKILVECPRLTSLGLEQNPDSILDVVSGNFKKFFVHQLNPDSRNRIEQFISRNKSMKSLTVEYSDVESSYLKLMNHEICEELSFYLWCYFSIEAFQELLKLLKKTKILHTFSFNECLIEEIIPKNSLLQALAFNSKSLRVLDLYSRVHDSLKLENPSYFSSLVNLEVLNLGGDVLVNDKFLTVIGNHCIKLREVNLIDSNEETNAGVVGIIHLPKLQNLRLVNLKKLSGQVLQNAPSLKKLYCHECPNPLNESDLTKLLKTSPNIDYIKIRLSKKTELNPDVLLETGVEKLTLIVEGSDYSRKTVTKFGPRVYRKTVKMCGRCVQCHPFKSRDCNECIEIDVV